MENLTPENAGMEAAPAAQETAAPPAKQHKKKRRKGIVAKILLRATMVFLSVILIVLCGAWMLLDTIFNGPSEAARDVLVMSLAKSSGTWWIPGVFLGEELAQQIMRGDQSLAPPPNESNTDIIDVSGALNSNSDEWKDYPDGIRIETVYGNTYTAHVMIIRDPSSVYLATSYQHQGQNGFSTGTPGLRIPTVLEKEGAIAGINAGAFLDNGSASSVVGSVPYGLVVAGGEIVWNRDSHMVPFGGFVGFNQDNVLVVAPTMTAERAKELNIRDGCEFGPVLIVDGVVNEEAYNNESGFNPRTAIGQRADGAVIMVCIDGRQAGSVGGSFADMTNIMVEFGAVNACNLDGGSSSIMLYRDTLGRYGAAGQVVTVNSYSLLQEEPRRMPTFFLVRGKSEG